LQPKNKNAKKPIKKALPKKSKQPGPQSMVEVNFFIVKIIKFKNVSLSYQSRLFRR